MDINDPRVSEYVKTLTKDTDMSIAMQAQEGKLFKPLAFTKTFALLAALVLGLILIPALSHAVLSIRFDKEKSKRVWAIVFAGLGLALLIIYGSLPAIGLILFGANNYFESKWPE